MKKERRRIEGKVVWKDLGPGCWGIIDDEGNEWRAVNMPEQIKHPGKRVKVWLEPVEEDVSIFMWGKAARITGFET
ncbi:MAG: hypothetical protein KatS3mg030_192 [Saprospiraceae bacterium]|nr:MAG: hypothetical protein KatS3mg030_187 [Saprospiraceae bacterium]GIV31890.1 MAG: hypothetical protein KatS3mg030_192 [Saprospiraceae bacterium]